MENEKITVDYEGLASQIRDDCKKDGLTINVFMPNVEKDIKDNVRHYMPLVDVEGFASPMTIAFTIKTLETLMDALKEKEGVDEALEIVGSLKSTTIQGKWGEEKND